jgi:hypothetical protein
VLYRAADCYLQGSDSGYGFFDSSSGGIYCSANANNSPAGRVEGFAPITTGSSYLEAGFSTVWQSITALGSGFSDSCDCSATEDNGAGLSWPVSVPANGSTTVSFLTQSSPTGTVVNPNAPITATDPATDVTSNSATLNGTVNPNGQTTSYHFEYGLDASHGSSTATDTAGSDSSTHAKTASLSGLQPDKTYHYWIVASSVGGTTHGQDVTFKTAAVVGPPPTATTGSATDVTTSSAKLHGSVNPHGKATTYHFEFGLTPSYGGSTAITSAGADNSAHPELASISGLKPSTTYHYRIVAKSANGTSDGDDATFKTPAPAGPGPPQAGENVNATATGDVTVKCPGQSEKQLGGKEQKFPLDCLVDASFGTVQLVWDDGCAGNGKDTGSFGGEPFVPTQPKDPRPPCAKGLILDLNVRDPQPTDCDTADVSKASLPAGPFRALSHHRHVRSHHHHSGATVRGTQWQVTERCDGTLTRVLAGVVAVRDFTLHKTVLVHAGHSYLARAPGGVLDEDTGSHPGKDWSSGDAR